MHAPLYSTITLFLELLISAAVYYTIYKGFKHNKFSTKIAFSALIYETLFNITYMVSRVPAQVKVHKAQPLFVILFAIIHGTLSLIMFIALIVFFVIAWRKYKKEINFFKDHKIMTWLFLTFWTLSIVSGVLFYVLEYII